MGSRCQVFVNQFSDLIICDVIASRKYRTHIQSSLSGKEFESELETWKE